LDHLHGLYGSTGDESLLGLPHYGISTKKNGDDDDDVGEIQLNMEI
jgi:hypothetical protein